MSDALISAFSAEASSSSSIKLLARSIFLNINITDTMSVAGTIIIAILFIENGDHGGVLCPGITSTTMAAHIHATLNSSFNVITLKNSATIAAYTVNVAALYT